MSVYQWLHLPASRVYGETRRPTDWLDEVAEAEGSLLGRLTGQTRGTRPSSTLAPENALRNSQRDSAGDEVGVQWGARRDSLIIRPGRKPALEGAILPVVKRQGPMSPLSVLVVDDHPIVRDAVGALVDHTEGLRVWGTAVSGSDAIAQLEATGPGGTARPDGPEVVVTDLRMPGMDGLELVAEVRSRWPAVPCLVFSAQDRLSSAGQATAAGAAGFVEKGDSSALIAAVRRVGAESA